MAKKKEISAVELIEETNSLLRKQLILQLALQGVQHQNIRKIVKCDMSYVTEILKPLKGKLSPK